MIVTVASQREGITFQWLGAWAQWDDFQKSEELMDLFTKSNAILPKQGTGGGKSKAAGRSASRQTQLRSIQVSPRSLTKGGCSPPIFDVVQPTAHVNSMGLGSESKRVQGLDNTVSKVPIDWRKTSFNMLRKHGRAKVPAEYRPIASIRLLYKTFVYMSLGRVEPFLEAAQPEEQHGFRSGRRIEEHLVTANLVIDKSWSVNMPIWIISLDLSKAFDRVHWPSLWRALSQQGISDLIIWLLQNLYKDQTGQIAGTNESRLFHIKQGVRQGCVLSPRLFFAVLEMAMGMWRRALGRLGLDLGDGGPTLLDLRFADDILIFVTTYIDAGLLLDELMVCLSQVGLVLNTAKTKVMTTEAQPPSFLSTPAGLQIEICHAILQD